MRKVFLAAALGTTLALSPMVAADEATSGRSKTFEQLEFFGDVFERVRADYVEDITDAQLIEFAIQGMLASLDPHSSYLDESSYGDMEVNTRGEFGGLGIEVTMDGGYVKVIAPIDDSPASRAGLMANDLITHLDGESVQGLALRDAVQKMRGPIDTDITLTVRRVGEPPFDVTLTRDVITVQAVRWRREGDVGYVRIQSFTDQTKPGLERAIRGLKDEMGAELKGIVLDLRNNPGGLFEQAVEVSDAFLDKGEIVSTRGRRTEDIARRNARPGDLVDGLPVVVLINGGSASASEIVAGALQDHRRAILLGTRTFGKGSVQTIIRVPGHGALRLTTARYYTPSGTSIQAKGIEPDILVQQARLEVVEAPAGRREADLRGALDRPGGTEEPGEEPAAGDDEDVPAPAPDAEVKVPADGLSQGEAAAPQDYQLARAIDLLHGISLYNRRTMN